MSQLPRRSVLIGAAFAPFAGPMVPHAWADGLPAATGPLISVKDYGAIGDGVADDTAAIEAAFAASGFNGPMYFPPGNYVYNGTGLDSPSNGSVEIFGQARFSTTIILGSSSYFINYSRYLIGLQLKELTFLGGKGAVRHTYTGVNVQQKYIVENCIFRDYTECAISTDSQDMPYWIIRNSFFTGANTTTSIGVSLGFGTDQCVIDSCSFLRNRVHIKAIVGNNFHITRCDLLQFTKDNTAGPRVSVWIVPNATAANGGTGSVNAGSGLTITGSKFGNENLMPGDFRILYADEDKGGTTSGARFPILDNDSTGYIRGHNITQNAFIGAGSPNSHPIIYSTTPNVWELQVHHNVISGGQPTAVVEFRNPSKTPDRLASTSVFGPFTGVHTTSLPFPASNSDGLGYWQDPQGVLQRAKTVRTWTSGASASFKEILSTAITSFSTASATTINIPDAYGGPDAVSFTMTNQSAVLYSSLSTSFVVGMPTWVEFDVSNPDDGKGATQFYALISDDHATIHWRQCVEVPSPDQGWVTYSFCFTPRTTGQDSTRIVFRATGESEAGKTVNLARTRVYQGNERQLGGTRPSVGGPATTDRDAVALVNDLRNKLIALGVLSGTPNNKSTGFSMPTNAPLHSNSTGQAGQVEWDSNFLYVCTSENMWKRVPLVDDKW